MIDSNFDCPGWATAFDPRTGRQYFINLIEKTTSWEDPRLKLKQHYGHVQSIPMQTLTMHGSPKNVQVYPTQSNYPAQAFQSTSGQSVPSVHASPAPSTKAMSQSHYSQSHHTQVEMSSLSRSSPHTPRVGNLIKHNQLMQQQQVQETSFSTPAPFETDATVAKINAMFPTASEHHIRLLLKKYHNREAVVISALQVEKHPTHTPGPNTPPPPRSFHSLGTTALALSAFGTPPSSSALSRKALHHLYSDHLTINSSIHGSPSFRPQSSASYYTSGYAYGSPQQFKNSPKPHGSPKMKLRYLKSQFPKAEETVILDVLAMVENNVQKAAEQLVRMGYEKKEITPAPRLSHRMNNDVQVKKEVKAQPTPPPKPKTAEEKKKLKAKLESQYENSIPAKVIAMALESVDYSEEKALKILEIVLQDEKDTKRKSEEKKEKDKKRSDVERTVSFKDSSLRGSKSIDLDKAAAIENDENMIINSDHSIITTPIESPQDAVDQPSKSKKHSSPAKAHSYAFQSESDETPTSEESDAVTIDKSKKRHKARSDSARSTKSEAKQTVVTNKTIMMEESKEGNYMSIVTKTVAQGPNCGLSKGPKDDLLLADYVAWSGANPEILNGKKVVAKGANSSLRIDRSYTPRGPSSGLCKGPKVGLAIGSIYSQRSRPNVACN